MRAALKITAPEKYHRANYFENIAVDARPGVRIAAGCNRVLL
jgi:hypothetical protein